MADSGNEFLQEQLAKMRTLAPGLADVIEERMQVRREVRLSLPEWSCVIGVLEASKSLICKPEDLTYCTDIVNAIRAQLGMLEGDDDGQN